MKFYSPLTDISFKKLFGIEKNEAITIHFLNAVLNLPQDRLIEKIEIQQTKQKPLEKGRKEIDFDVYCTDKQKNHFIIEMQALNQYNFFERSQFYIARALAGQLPKGGEYINLVPVIFLGVVNYNLNAIAQFKLDEEFRTKSVINLEKFITESDEVISQYSFMNRKTGKIIPAPLFELNYIELPKFKKTLKECESLIDQWLFFMKAYKTP